jgi:uncharacterized protein (TIGR03067 family)
MTSIFSSGSIFSRLHPATTGNDADSRNVGALRSTMFAGIVLFSLTGCDKQDADLSLLMRCATVLTLSATGDQSDPLAELAGTWDIVDVKLEGKSLQDNELTGSKFIFRKGVLVIHPGNGKEREEFTIRPEPDAQPSAFHATRIHPPNRPKQKGWFIYKREDDTLRIAFTDALRSRPVSFEPAPKLLVISLKRITSPAPKPPTP